MIVANKSKLFRLYLRDIMRFHPLETDDERSLVEAVRRGDLDARKKLITANLRFVITIARRALIATQKPIEFDMPVNGDDSCAMAEQFPDPSEASPETCLSQKYSRKELQQMLDRLSDRGQFVIFKSETVR